MINDPFILEIENLDKFIEVNKEDKLIVRIALEIKKEFLKKYNNDIRNNDYYFKSKGYYTIINNELKTTYRCLAKYMKLISQNKETFWLVNDGSEDWDMINVDNLPYKCKKLSK